MIKKFVVAKMAHLEKERGKEEEGAIHKPSNKKYRKKIKIYFMMKIYSTVYPANINFAKMIQNSKKTIFCKNVENIY